MYYYKTVLLLFGFFMVPFSVASKPIVIWHQKEQATIFLKHELESLADKMGFKVQVIYMPTNDLKSALIKSIIQKTPPDIVLAPSDFINYRKFLSLSKINLNEFNFSDISEQSKQTVSSNDQLYGIPLLIGNHLILYYNKKYVSAPATTWEKIQQQNIHFKKIMVNPIGWNYQETYYFLPFLSAFNASPTQNNTITINSKEMSTAMTFYKKLSTSGFINKNCDYDCCFKYFIQGKYAYAINGDWAYAEFKKALGGNLGVTKLPSINGKAMKSYVTSISWIFPNNSLQGHHKEHIKAIIELSLSEYFQYQLYKKFSITPAIQKVQDKIKQKEKQDYSIILQLLHNSVVITPRPELSAAWLALQKGFDYFLSVNIKANKVVKLMQKSAQRELKLINTQESSRLHNNVN